MAAEAVVTEVLLMELLTRVVAVAEELLGTFILVAMVVAVTVLQPVLLLGQTALLILAAEAVAVRLVMAELLVPEEAAVPVL